MLRLLDLFSGIGGFSLAATRVGGFTTVGFVERDRFCQRVLREWWPDVPIHDDIRTFRPGQGAADVVCAGFPCQDLSVAGRRREGIEEGTRSGLFFEAMRVVRVVRPRYVVLENVAAITVDGLGVVLGELASAGFDAEWACIPASDLGACHRRDRWWLVAYSSDERSEGGWRQGLGKSAAPSSSRGALWRAEGPALSPDWSSYLCQPVLRRGDDGLSDRVDRMRALGNAVVPAVAAVPLARVKELEDACQGPELLLDMLEMRWWRGDELR